MTDTDTHHAPIEDRQVTTVFDQYKSNAVRYITRLMVDMRRDGKTVKAIAGHFGVSQSLVSRYTARYKELQDGGSGQ